MKVLFTLLLTGAAVLAQTPAPKKAAPSAAKKVAPRPSVPDLYRVKFATTHGDFVVEVHRDWAPIGAARFYSLVRQHFFTNEAFFRIVPNFIVQWGLSPSPAVNKQWEKANIKDDPVKQHNTRGTVVFATAGPNTRTTQLFINLHDNTSSLDSQGFAPFGTVTEGMEIVDGLYAGYGERPDQGMITDQGAAYLNKNFPKLDRITSATIIFPEPAAPAKKAAPAPKK
ncbi:MAG TPA: peptidylprolyl isomerase [Bryobacteraceae bacterium]|nr:peptidylprolyl isomerase [Bryobacteraceae bacterium]